MTKMIETRPLDFTLREVDPGKPREPKRRKTAR